MNLSNILKTLGPRLIGIVATAVAGWLYQHAQGSIVMDPESTTKLVVGLLTTYAVSHRVASSQINPGDAATGRVAEAVHEASDLGTTVRVDPKQ